MLANIDRAVVADGSRARLDKDGNLTGIKGLLECKTASAYLEREWLAFLHRSNLRLPDDAQHRLADCNTVADFYYSEGATAVYIDGYYHQNEDARAEDRRITSCLEDAGYSVIRFDGDRSAWPALVRGNAWLFGDLRP